MYIAPHICMMKNLATSHSYFSYLNLFVFLDVAAGNGIELRNYVYRIGKVLVYALIY